MTDPINEIRATDPDPFDDVLHFISKFPPRIPADKTWDGKEYVWEDHMDINPTDGLITVRPLPDLRSKEDETFIFEVTATDGLNTVYEEATFVVKHVDQPPQWNYSPLPVEILVQEGGEISFRLTATDRDLRENEQISYVVQGGVPLTGTMVLNADGTFTGTAPQNPGNANTVIDFNVIASTFVNGEIGLSAPLPVRIIIEDVNRKPIWVTPAVHSPPVGPFTLTLEAVDPDATPIVKYDFVAGAEGNFVITGNTLTYTGGFPDTSAQYQIVLGAFDSANSYTQQIFTFNVSEIPNLPPVWQTSGSLHSGQPGDTVNRTVVATDPEGAAVTYAWSGDVPPGLTLGATSGIVSGTISASAGARVYSFTITASDGENVVPRVFSVALSTINLPPVWDTPAGVILDVFGGEPVDVQLAATDPEGAALNYTLSKPAELSWLNMSANGRLGGTVPTGAAEYTGSITVTVSDGTHSVPRTFTVKISRLEPVTVNFAADRTWTVPRGCYSLMVIWAVSGGAGGGAGHQYGNGGGGGGGGTGGYERHVALAVAPGDVLRLVIGAGGAGSIGGSGDRVTGTGGDGGNTVIYKNDVAVLAVGGGKGGAVNTNWNQGYIVAPGGEGGTPNGLRGVDGQSGSGDRASCSGGSGEHGPLLGALAGPGGQAAGGADGVSGPGAGKNGTGYGSSGGGGGSHDRSGGTYWRGGNGVGGFIEFTYPSQGVVTDTNSPHYGTPPWSAAPVETNNYIAFYGPQAGSSRQANFYANTPSMGWNIGSGGGQISSCAVFGPGVWEIYSEANYTGTMVLVDGANQQFNISSFQGLGTVRSAKRQGS